MMRSSLERRQQVLKKAAEQAAKLSLVSNALEG